MNLRRRDRDRESESESEDQPVRRRSSGRGAHAEPRGKAIVRTARRLVGPAILAVITVGVFTLGAFPTRTLLEQRRETAAAEAQLQELDASNADAGARAAALKTDSVIESLARGEYGLAKPGEELYHVLPAPQDPVRVPDAWPFNGLGSTLDR